MGKGWDRIVFALKATPLPLPFPVPSLPTVASRPRLTPPHFVERRGDVSRAQVEAENQGLPVPAVFSGPASARLGEIILSTSTLQARAARAPGPRHMRATPHRSARDTGPRPRRRGDARESHAHAPSAPAHVPRSFARRSALCSSLRRSRRRSTAVALGPWAPSATASGTLAARSAAWSTQPSRARTASRRAS